MDPQVLLAVLDPTGKTVLMVNQVSPEKPVNQAAPALADPSDPTVNQEPPVKTVPTVKTEPQDKKESPAISQTNSPAPANLVNPVNVVTPVTQDAPAPQVNAVPADQLDPLETPALTDTQVNAVTTA